MTDVAGQVLDLVPAGVEAEVLVERGSLPRSGYKATRLVSE